MASLREEALLPRGDNGTAHSEGRRRRKIVRGDRARGGSFSAACRSRRTAAAYRCAVLLAVATRIAVPAGCFSTQRHSGQVYPCGLRNQASLSKTELSGVRTLLKRKISSWRNGVGSKDMNVRQQQHQENQRKQSTLEAPSVGVLESQTEALGVEKASVVMSHSATTTVTRLYPADNETLPVTFDLSHALTNNETLPGIGRTPLYSLPPINREMTELECEFRDMLAHFADYTESDIRSLRDSHMRAVFEGVVASAHEPAVYRAFEVLFEDLYPLRLAGRLIYKRLKQLMRESVREREEEVATVVAATELEAQEVEETRLAFVSTACRLNGDAHLTTEQLAETGLLAITAVDSLGFDRVDQLLERLDPEGTGKVDFVQMATGLNRCTQEMCAFERCCPATVMHGIMHQLTEQFPAADSLALDGRRQRYSDNYDRMVTTFCQWKGLVPTGSGRRLDVVRGCFVGAEQPQVVQALRVVYCDYSALRIAGDLIFNLCKAVMQGRSKRKARQQ